MGQLGLFTTTADAAPAATTPATIPVGTQPLRLAVDSSAHRAYVANRGANTVSVIDTTSDTQVGTIAVAGNPYGVAVDPGAHTLYVTLFDTSRLVQIDISTATPRVVATAPVGTQPDSVTVDPTTHLAYTANTNGHSVSVVDFSGSAPSVTSVVLGGGKAGPADIAIDPGAHKLFVTSQATDYNLYTIDTQSLSVNPIRIGNYTYGVAIDPSTHRAYVSSANDPSVLVYSTTTDALASSISLGGNQTALYGVAVDPSAKALYVTDRPDNRVNVVDLTTNAVSAATVGTAPYGAAVDTALHKAYVTNSADNTVTVLGPTSFAPQAQAITFTTTPPSDARVGGTYQVAATGGGSGQPVTFSIDASSSASTCTVSSTGTSTGTVSFSGTGTCVLDADQAGASGYDAAPQAQQSFAVKARDAQAITFTSAAPSPAYVGDHYTATATGGGSGNPVTFTLGKGTTAGACTVDDQGDGSATVSFAGVGVCEVAADQGGGARYDAAPQAVQQIDVTKKAASSSYGLTDTVPVGGSLNTIVADSGTHRAYVTDAGGNRVSVIDTTTHKTVGSVPVGASPYGIALDTDAGRAYVANNGSNTVSVIDTSASPAKVVATISGFGIRPDGVAVDPGTHRLLVTSNNDQVAVVDTTTNAVLGKLPVGNEPIAVAVDTANHTGYVANASAGTVSVLDTTGNGSVVKTISVGGRPARVAVDPVSHQAYVTNFNGSSVWVIDTRAGTLSTTVQVGSRAFGIGVDPVSHRAFATGYGDNTVSVIDEASNTVVKTVTVGNGPRSVAVDTSTHAAFVANGGEATVSVVEPTGSTPPASKPQTITFSTDAPSPAYVGDSYTVRASGGDSGNPVTFSGGGAGSAPDGDPAEPACVITDNGDSTAKVYLSQVGTCEIDADQAGASGYDAAPQAAQSFPVVLHGQQIRFTSTAPSSPVVGESYDVSADGGGSGTPVTFTTADPGTCTVDDHHDSTGRVTFTGAGSCEIDADQAGTTTYAAAAEVHQTVRVSRQAQTIRFTSNPPSSAVVGDAYDISANGGGSGEPVTFTTADRTTCTVADRGDSTGRVTFTGAGTCEIDANQVSTDAYDPAPQAEQTISVVRQAQAITFTSRAPTPGHVGDTYVVSATGGGSDEPVTFTTGDSSPCTVVDNGDSTGRVSFTGAGSCEIDANQISTYAYDPAPQAQQTISVVRQAQAITFTSQAPSSAHVTDTYVVTAHGGASGRPVVFSTDSSGCTVAATGASDGDASGDSAATVTFTGAGTCVVDADQAGSDAYTAAPQAQQTISVVRQAQAITFTSKAPSPAHVTDTYDVSATGGKSGKPVTFTTADPTTCTVADNGDSTGRVTFTGAGTCVVEADQVSTDAYDPAPQAEQSIEVTKQDQAITFTSQAPTSAHVTDTYTVRATGGKSDKPVTFTTADPTTCTVADNGDSTGSVSLTGVGTCEIDANQAGNDAYNPAPQAHQSVTVTKRAQSITVSGSPTAPKVGSSYSLTGTGGGSGNPVTFTRDATSSNGACTVTDSGKSTAKVTLTGAGTCVVDADQAGNASYSAAPRVQRSVTVARTSQAITLSGAPIDAKAGRSYTLTGTGGGSGNPVTFTRDATSTSGACTVTDSGKSTAKVTLTGAGTCVVDADQAGNASYAPAPRVQRSVTVARTSQAITLSGAPIDAKAGRSYTLTGTGGGSGNPVTFTRDATSDAGACTVVDSGKSTAKVNLTGNGTCVVDADQAGNASYAPAPRVQQSVGVGVKAQHIALSSTSPPKSVVGRSYTVTGSGGGSGNPVTFSLDPASGQGTCTVSDNRDSTATVAITGTGSCLVDADQAGAKGYYAAPRAQLPLATGATRQAITITSDNQARYPVDTSYTVSADAGASGKPVVLRIDGSTTAECDIKKTSSSGGTYSAKIVFSGVGQCVVVADEAGSATYQPAQQRKLSLKVNAAQQAITFTTTPPDPGRVGGTYNVAAVGGASGNPVTFSIDPATQNSCSVASTGDSKARVTFANVSHPCIILADQAASEDGNYNASPGSRQVVTIRK